MNRRRNSAKNRVRARKKRDKRRRRSISGVSVAAFVLVCIFTMLLVTGSSSSEEQVDTKVILKVADETIKQGEEKPVFTAEVICEGDSGTILETASGYKVADLMDELNRGIGYTLECEGDGSQEGEFQIKAELTSEISTPLYHEWFGKIDINIEHGMFTVQNPYGQWDKNGKFELWEGGYAKSQFITSKGCTYYMDEKNEKVTGWQEIGGSSYYFEEDGVMKIGWMETEEGTYYFHEDGTKCVGWLKTDDEKYYFDKDGKMYSGELKVGIATYTFDETGKLISAEGVADPDKPMVALTFDDGPGVRTMELLELLEENGARATFFMLGRNAAIYQDTVKKMAEIGCELGNHSYDHSDLAKLDAEGISRQIDLTDKAVMEATGQSTTVMRPPYGSINDTVKENVKHPMILWSIDTLDWQTRDAKKTVNNVMENVQDGDIILMHDIHSETIDAVEKLIPKLKKAGYQMVTVSELAEARGITLENGIKYGRFRKQD